jgi:DNA-binding MarR family transcriptional regulator
MNVKIEIQLTEIPQEHEIEQIYSAAKSITNNKKSISITPSTKQPLAVIAEFTIKKARQIDVVDHIGQAFWQVDHYGDLNISFTKKTLQERSHKAEIQETSVTYTQKQGQYLAFIYYYTKINNESPAEKDFQRYFRVTPPSIHQMIIQLEKKGFIKRTPRQPRSIQLLLSRNEIPDLL